MKSHPSLLLSVFLLVISPLLWATNSYCQAALPQSYVIDSAIRAGKAASLPVFDIEIAQDSEEKFIVAVNNPRGEKINIIMYTPSGDRYYDRTKLGTYNKTYNLAGADIGKYTIKVTNGKKTVSKVIQLNGSADWKRSIEVK